MPIWVTAASKAATQILLGQEFEQNQMICLPDNQSPVRAYVKSGAQIDNGNSAIAISLSDPGLVLDITRGMEIWAFVRLEKKQDKPSKGLVSDGLDSWLDFVAGHGVGKILSTGKPSISGFAYKLFELNLKNLVPQGCRLHLEIAFPDGKQLAERTSNQAFGVVDGLALIGTQAEVQVSASPDQQKNIIDQLRKKCSESDFLGDLIFVIGENGFDLAIKYGFRKTSILKIGNWIGPAIVAAGELGVKNLLLFGYHGKLIKLAGGIFHTHHHLADARIEILVFLALQANIPIDLIHQISKSNTIEDALINLEKENIEIVKKLWLLMANTIEFRSLEYIKRYTLNKLEVGAVLFDRKRSVRWIGLNAEAMFLKPDNF